MSTAVHRSSDPTHFKIQLADEPVVNLCGFLLGFYTVIWYDLFHLEKSAVSNCHTMNWARKLKPVGDLELSMHGPTGEIYATSPAPLGGGVT